MESLLRAQKGKTNLTVENDVYHHRQNDVLTESFPKILLLYDGHKLKINQSLITNGLATISIRNMRSKKSTIEKRNSFFNLHRPELKGLHIVLTENRQENMLQQHILKEVKTIHETKSVKLFFIKHRPQIPSASKQSKNVDDKMKSQCGLLMGTHLQKKLITKTFDQQKNLMDGPGTKPEESTHKLCMHEVETISTLID